MLESSSQKTLYLLDGHALVYRAFYAMISRPLTTSKGENTSAPFGLARFLIRILNDFQPDYIGVVFDAGDSYRTEVFPAYKATREKMPEELALSLQHCRDVVEGFRVPAIEVEGWEADDVIGTLARQAAREGILTVIVSGDKDFYQLIDSQTHLLNPGRGGASGIEETFVTPATADERLGVAPEFVTDYLALIGDSSDNIPGVRGIGPKTAPGLIQRFGHLESILEHTQDIEAKRVRSALEQYAEDASMSKQLVTIRTDVPITLDLDGLRRDAPDRERLSALFLELEFHRLAREFAPDAKVESEGDNGFVDLANIPSAEGSPANQAPDQADCEVVVHTNRISDIVSSLRKARAVGIRSVTSGNPLRTHLVGLGLAASEHESWYLSFAHEQSSTTVDEEGNPVLALDTLDTAAMNLPPLASDELAELRSLLEDPGVPKWSSDAKHDLHALARAGVRLAGMEFDSSLASYCLDPGKRQHDLEFVVLERLGRTVLTRADVCGTGRSLIPIAEANPDRAAAHAGGGAAALLAVGVPMREDLDSYEMTRLLEDVELPLVPVLAAMERTGIEIDIGFFDQLHKRLAHDLELVQDEIYALAGGEVNLRSVPQMRTLLFEKLQLPVLRKTKTGPSTDESVLSALAADGHAVPRLILEHRELDKLDSTYVRKLPSMVDPATGRIHTSFNQTVAATGRLSSSDPNLQNIPIRSSLGREIRKGFVPAEGCVFLSADYSQVELRILAHLSADSAFVAAFREGRDIHRETAASIFRVSADDVSPGMRDQAKTINFATIYGQGPVALAAQLGIDRSEATEFISSYFERFAGVAQYLEAMKEQARSQGFVETLLGRRRYIPEIRARNPGVRGFGERTAANSPIQGTAADLIKLAMIRIHERLAETSARMILQVHDELLFESSEDYVEQLRTMVCEEMEGAIELDVPLRVDIGVGKSWYLSKGG